VSVLVRVPPSVVMKLKYHRLKPGGVCPGQGSSKCSYEIEVPPAKAWWCAT